MANDGGYLTLSFIPTLGTMILGLIAGRWLGGRRRRFRLKNLVGGSGRVGGGIAAACGWDLSDSEKELDAEWTLFSGGICFLFLAAFCWVIEAKGYKKWAFPLIVIGMNSMAAYLIAHLTPGFIFSTFRTHLGANVLRLGVRGCSRFLRGRRCGGVLVDVVLDV